VLPPSFNPFISWTAFSFSSQGLVLAFGYKVTISDMQKNAIDNFYANYNPDEDKKK